MEEQFVFHEMEDWGYSLLDKAHPDSPGYTGLLVAIRQTPTELHFDPEAIELRLAEPGSQIRQVTLGLNLAFSASRRVCAGQVVLRDRIDKRVNFFVFGGTLEATTVPGETVYSLRSSAPILALTERRESAPTQLALETESLLAKIQAKWGLNDAGFTERLVQVDPHLLYVACLDSILTSYQQTANLRHSFHEFYEMLLREKEWLVQSRQWPITSPGLARMLGPA